LNPSGFVSPEAQLELTTPVFAKEEAATAQTLPVHDTEAWTSASFAQVAVVVEDPAESLEPAGHTKVQTLPSSTLLPAVQSALVIPPVRAATVHCFFAQLTGTMLASLRHVCVFVPLIFLKPAPQVKTHLVPSFTVEPALQVLSTPTPSEGTAHVFHVHARGEETTFWFAHVTFCGVTSPLPTGLNPSLQAKVHSLPSPTLVGGSVASSLQLLLTPAGGGATAQTFFSQTRFETIGSWFSQAAAFFAPLLTTYPASQS
jgi:hypothetical protein